MGNPCSTADAMPSSKVTAATLSPVSSRTASVNVAQPIAPPGDEAQLGVEGLRSDLAVQRIGSDAVVAEDENVTARHDGGH